MDRRTCVITGANSGIGRAAAIQLAREGWHVVLACRSRERSETALREVEAAGRAGSARLMLVDLSSQASIRRFAGELQDAYERLEGLLHNAADFDVGRSRPLPTVDGVESVWATNHLGPVLLTELLLPALRSSRQGRIVTVSSKGLTLYPRLTVDFEDPEFQRRKFSAQKAYYQSKLAQVMYTYWLAGQLAGSGATVNCVRVTNVKIDIRRYPDLSALQRLAYGLKSRFSITPEEMARTYVYLLASPEVADVSGRCFDENRKVMNTSAFSCDGAAIEKLMSLTERYLGPLAASRSRAPE